MSLYDRIQPHLDKTDAEISAIPGLMDEPRLVPLDELNEILLASGAWSVLTVIAASDNQQAAGLASATLGLFQGKLKNFDAKKYRAMLDGVVAVLAGQVSAESIAAIKELCGVGRPNPTEAEVAAARAEGEWRDARLVVEQAIDARFDAYRVAYNEAKRQLGELNVGNTIPTASELWA